MSYQYFNPNPCGKRVGDCAVRAVAKALDVDWDTSYSMISSQAYFLCDMPSSDVAWGATLRQHGFKKAVIPNNRPDSYTAGEFANDNPYGIFVLGFGGHTATVIDGVLYDSWDSSNEIPIYFWYRKDD